MGEPTVEQKVTGLNPTGNGFGDHLHKDIGCLAVAFPATSRPDRATVKVRTQWDQPIL